MLASSEPAPNTVAPPGSEHFFSIAMNYLPEWPNMDDPMPNTESIDPSKNLMYDWAELCSWQIQYLEKPIISKNGYVWLVKPLSS